MARCIALVILVLLAGIDHAFGQGQPAPWPMYGHDARHSGRTALVGPQTNEVAWQFPTSYSPFNVAATSVPAVGADGTIYIATLDDKVLAVASTGTIKWEYQAGAFISHLSPAIGSDGTIYIGSSNGKLYAINPDGTERWTLQTAGSLGIVTIGPDDAIYVGSDGGALYAVNPGGTERWQFRGCPSIGPTPGCYGLADQPMTLGSDGAVYFHNGGGCIDEPPLCTPSTLIALNADGSVRWRRSTGSIGGFGLSLRLNTLYFPSNAGWLLAFRLNGTVKWAYPAGVTAGASVGPDGTAYLAAGDGLHAITPLGTRRWLRRTPQVLRDRPAIGGDGAIYVNGDYQDVYAINPNGTFKWFYQIPGTPPAGVAIGPDNRLYLGTGAAAGSNSYLYAFGPASPAAP